MNSGAKNESHFYWSGEEAVKMANEFELDVDSVIQRLLSGIYRREVATGSPADLNGWINSLPPDFSVLI